MITAAQYFCAKCYPAEHEANASTLLARVNCLLTEAAEVGVYGHWVDPDTGSQISGAKGGSGDGGYRAADSKTGASKSMHKAGHAVDVYDPERKLAAWCVAHQTVLDLLELYCEDFRWTPGWCHFQDVPPASRKHIYIPVKTPPLAPALPGQKPVPFDIK